MSNDRKRSVGTIEGVALILAILACLTLFLKILPNLNQNAEFYNEQFIAFQRQLDQLKVSIDNLERTYRTPKYHNQIRELQEMARDLEISKREMPEEIGAEFDQLRAQINDILDQLKTKR